MCDVTKTNDILYLAASIQGFDDEQRAELAKELKDCYEDVVTGEVSKAVFSVLVGEPANSVSDEAQEQVHVIGNRLRNELSHSRLRAT